MLHFFSSLSLSLSTSTSISLRFLSFSLVLHSQFSPISHLSTRVLHTIPVHTQFRVWLSPSPRVLRSSCLHSLSLSFSVPLCSTMRNDYLFVVMPDRQAHHRLFDATFPSQISMYAPSKQSEQNFHPRSKDLAKGHRNRFEQQFVSDLGLCARTSDSSRNSVAVELRLRHFGCVCQTCNKHCLPVADVGLPSCARCGWRAGGGAATAAGASVNWPSPRPLRSSAAAWAASPGRGPCPSNSRSSCSRCAPRPAAPLPRPRPRPRPLPRPRPRPRPRADPSRAEPS